MDLEDLVEELTVVGLDEDQARTYVRLLQAGPAKVGPLSAYFDCSRSTVYRLLDDLVEQGLATKSLDTPTVYQAAPPADLFEAGEARILDALEQLRSVEDRWLDTLRGFEQVDYREDRDHWKRIEGTTSIYEVLQTIIEEASESIDLLSNHELSVSLHLPVVERTWRCFWGGVRENPLECRFLLDWSKGRCNQLLQEAGPLENVRMRTFSLDQIVHFVLVDRREVLMWVRPTPIGRLGKREDVAVWTDAPGSVAAHKLLFEKLWPSGKPVEPVTVDPSRAENGGAAAAEKKP